MPEEWYRAPNFYFTNPHAAYGAHDDVPVPAGCSVLDFELEVGAVIGRAGRDLTPEQAREHIIGYLVFNDWSARDLQKPEKNLGLGFSKGKDFANTLGPCLVTADEVEDRRDADGFLDLEMTVTLNGELIGRDTLANVSWTFEEMVAYAARDAWVRPGDILGSGTCGWGRWRSSGAGSGSVRRRRWCRETRSRSPWRGSAACPTGSCPDVRTSTSRGPANGGAVHGRSSIVGADLHTSWDPMAAIGSL